MNTMKTIKTKEEAMIYILGMISGLNDVRIRFWGIGYDDNVTAQEIRKFTTDKIFKLKEMIEIDNFGDSMFSSVEDLLKKK